MGHSSTPCSITPVTNYQGFWDHISAAFANPLQTVMANRKIRALKQGKGSVSQYSTEFRLLVQDLLWNEAALMDQYMEGLADDILDELSRVDRPNTLQELITLCLRINGHLESQRLVRDSSHRLQPLLTPFSSCLLYTSPSPRD